jgi:hypothetical protein
MEEEKPKKPVFSKFQQQLEDAHKYDLEFRQRRPQEYSELKAAKYAEAEAALKALRDTLNPSLQSYAERHLAQQDSALKAVLSVNIPTTEAMNVAACCDAGLSKMFSGALADSQYLSVSQDFLNASANLAAADFLGRQDDEARKALISLNQAIGYAPSVECLNMIGAITGRVDLSAFSDATLRPWLEYWRDGDDEDFEHRSLALLIIRDFEQNGKIDADILPEDEAVHKKVFSFIKELADEPTEVLYCLYTTHHAATLERIKRLKDAASGYVITDPLLISGMEEIKEELKKLNESKSAGGATSSGTTDATTLERNSAAINKPLRFDMDAPDWMAFESLPVRLQDTIKAAQEWPAIDPAKRGAPDPKQPQSSGFEDFADDIPF